MRFGAGSKSPESWSGSVVPGGSTDLAGPVAAAGSVVAESVMPDAGTMAGSRDFRLSTSSSSPQGTASHPSRARMRQLVHYVAQSFTKQKLCLQRTSFFCNNAEGCHTSWKLKYLLRQQILLLFVCFQEVSTSVFSLFTLPDTDFEFKVERSLPDTPFSHVLKALNVSFSVSFNRKSSNTRPLDKLSALRFSDVNASLFSTEFSSDVRVKPSTLHTQHCTHISNDVLAAVTCLLFCVTRHRSGNFADFCYFLKLQDDSILLNSRVLYTNMSVSSASNQKKILKNTIEKFLQNFGRLKTVQRRQATHQTKATVFTNQEMAVFLIKNLSLQQNIQKNASLPTWPRHAYIRV